MNYGLYLSATGTLTAMHRQDVIANNLANVQTVGYKPDRVDLRDRLPARLDAPHSRVDPHIIFEQLGGGHFIAPTRTDFTQGAIERTGNNLDLALRGDGFFVVESERGTGAQRHRFTRDGRFTLNPRGEIVLAANGMRVLDADNRPIRLERGANVAIDAEGRVHQDGRLVAQIQVTDVADASTLRKAGENLFVADDPARVARTPSSAQIEQGHVEASAVDPIMTLNEMINVTKAAQANAKMIQFHDSLLDSVINRFGRVA